MVMVLFLYPYLNQVKRRSLYFVEQRGVPLDYCKALLSFPFDDEKKVIVGVTVFNNNNLRIQFLLIPFQTHCNFCLHHHFSRSV